MTDQQKNDSKPAFDNPVINWIDHRLPVFSMIVNEYASFPSPRNFNYMWNFGAIALFMLVLMIATGLFLSMHYTADTSLAFSSVEHIMRDVNYGWLIRYMHANGASFFLLVVYIHTLRGLYYGSYQNPREILWILGVIILFLMMATAFLGYVLPWGQMSLHGASVITGFINTIPFAGEAVIELARGAAVVDNDTLKRFYSLHFLLPFVIFGVSFLHIVALHITGSNNPTGIEPKAARDTVPFHPYYTIKDMFGLVVMLIIFCIFVFYLPNVLGHSDNYIPGDPLVTPPHIVPEWYFLPFYTVVRAVPNAFLGFVGMGAAIGILFLMPWLDGSKVKSARYRPLHRIFFWVFVVNMLVLGYLGAQDTSEPWLTLGRICSAYHFAHFLVIVPIISRLEKTLPLPSSIYDSVAKGKK